MASDFRLTAEEKDALGRAGYVVRHGVFSPAECAEITGAVEALVDDLVAAKRAEKETYGGYMFEMQRDMESIVKWEPDHPDVVQGVEPFVHLSKPLNDWAYDPRFMDPSRDVVGDDDIMLFTEKLTMKRAHTGGHIHLHQDYPYWTAETPVADKVMTALLYLDEATVENGCLEVAPGSHAAGARKGKDVKGFGANELDPAKFDTKRLIPVPAPAGSVVWFGPFLVHRSLPNRTARDRRALLYSYQPAGHPTALDNLKRWMAEKAA